MKIGFREHISPLKEAIIIASTTFDTINLLICNIGIVEGSCTGFKSIEDFLKYKDYSVERLVVEGIIEKGGNINV